MILAAGRGERMRPLTDKLPKPLLEIHGQSLLSHHLTKLHTNGCQRVVINHAWLGHLIEEKLGSGEQFGLSIKYSAETQALETAGGIATALTLLEVQDYFFVINGDVYAPDFPFNQLSTIVGNLRDLIKSGENPILAYLFLVKNPPHHPLGDFYLNTHTVSVEQIATSSQTKYTFSGAGLYHKDMFAKITPGTKAALAPLLKEAMTKNLVHGELLNCDWHDVGTPERLLELNQS
jgi:MurNAc alpha-1-phosphate uridylyltransferase